MNTSGNKNDIRSENPFERLIFEKGFRTVDVRIYPELDLMVIVLNNGTVLQVNLSTYPKLSALSPKKLSGWKVINGGIGIEWPSINYDISLKSLLEEHAVNLALQRAGQHME